MTDQYEIRTTVYHSCEWSDLVEQGWVTALVEHWLDRPMGHLVRTATMIRSTRRAWQ